MERLSAYVAPPFKLINNDPDFDYIISPEAFALLCQDLEIPSNTTRCILIEIAKFDSNFLGCHNAFTSKISIEATGTTLSLIRVLVHEMRHAQQWMKTGRSLKELYRMRIQGKTISLVSTVSTVMAIIHGKRYSDQNTTLTYISYGSVFLFAMLNFYISQFSLAYSYQNRPCEQDARNFENIVLQNYFAGKYPNLLTACRKG